ncbi:hypothetical protein V8B97DRAFT_2023441 [Scleroderma yunnanense]
MEDIRYSFTDPFLNHSTDKFSFSQPSSSVNIQDNTMMASKFDPPYVISCHHSASQHVFPQNSWEEPLELSAFLKEALNMTPSAPGEDMTSYHIVDKLKISYLHNSFCYSSPSISCPHAVSQPVTMPQATFLTTIIPHTELKNPSPLPTSCTTDVSSSHGTMDTLTAGLSLHLPSQKEATFLESVKKLAEELGQKIADITQEHSIAVKKISKLLTGHINYKKLHEVSFSNALIWAKVLEVNAGSKYSLIQLHQMVAKDPSLPDLDDEAKVQLKDELCAMWYGTDNAMNFWEDVLKLELYQVAKQFELWGCSQNKNITQWESLENMQRECVWLIETSFYHLVGNQTWLNCNNFNSTIKLKHGINKKGWPKTVPFTSPCSIPNVKLIHQLQDTLRTNQCYFVKMSSWEHQDFMKDLKVHQESGEIVKPSCKKHSDAGVPHKQKLTKQSGHQLKQTKNRRAAKSHKYILSTKEETEDSNEEGMDK